MKLLPASLAARTVVLIVAVVAVAELATLALVGEVRRSAHLTQTTQLVAAQVRLLQTVIPGLDAAARSRLAAGGEPGDDGAPPALQVVADGPAVPTDVPDFGFGRRLADSLAQQFGETLLLRHAGPPHGRHPPFARGERRPPGPANDDAPHAHGGLWIGFIAGGERWWLVLPPPRLEPPALPPQLLLALALALAVLVALAVYFVRSIVGPLARLGEAVAAAGDGERRPLAPEGPTEVRRLAERHNKMLAQLDAADAERREMLAGLTHDLRAPLARLRLRLALLDDEAASEARLGLLRDTADMERIVSQCLAFLRSERGTDPAAPPPAPLALAGALADTVAQHVELGHPLSLRVDPAAADCRVAIDPAALQRLLDNLIDNALRYGAPPVELSLAAVAGVPPASVCLCVRDHGPGIAAGERARALEAFTQIEPARATDGSCGLGLAIVRRIVDACAGSVSLGDAAGGGLKVDIRLPCA